MRRQVIIFVFQMRTLRYKGTNQHSHVTLLVAAAGTGCQASWFLVTTASLRRDTVFCLSGVGVLSGQLYATGGHDGPLVRKSVEVYDPGTNTWKQVADMNMCRRNAGNVTALSVSLGLWSFSPCKPWPYRLPGWG